MIKRWLSRMFGKDLAQPERPTARAGQTSDSFQSAEVDPVVVDLAHRLVELVNDSLALSHNSTNPETKVSRLEVAKANIAKLKGIALRHPYIKLLMLPDVEKTVAALESQYSDAGHYAQTPEDRRDYRQDVHRYLDPTDDLLTGYRFSATIQLRTPLRILSRHREVHEGRSDPPAIATELWQGVWLPRTKTLRELGIDIDEIKGSTMASDIGQIPEDGGDYLKFLTRLRTVLETDASVDERRAALKKLLKNDESGYEYVRKLGGRDTIVQQFFPAFVDTLPGLPVDARTALWAADLVTPQKISEACDKDLLAIKGIGPARLKTIRALCAQAENPNGEFVDRVLR